MLNPIGGNSSVQTTYNTKDKLNHKETKANDEKGVILDLGKKSPVSPGYQKPHVNKVNASEIDRLWKETNRTTAALRDLVEKAISRQGKSVKDVLDGKSDIVFDEQAKAEAQSLISEDGELGVKQTADRIVEFAKAISGGDKGRLSELRDAIKQGFSEASKVLGGLPDISQKTYDEVMSQLDKWEQEG